MSAITLGVVPKFNYPGCEWQVAFETIELGKKLGIELSIQVGPAQWIFVDQWSSVTDIENKVRAAREATQYTHAVGA